MRKLISNSSVSKLKLNKSFVPCPVDDNEEIFRNGIFEFNITRMIEHIRVNPKEFIVEEVAVDLFHQAYSSINEEHMVNVVIGEPVIIAEIAPCQYNLIDGNHRMEKARRLGITKLNAYRLQVHQHIQFLTSTEAYRAYVEYWNDKL